MENTCNHKECKFYKFLKFKELSQCLNYIETWWTQEKGEPKLIKDCSPKRTMIMVQELYNQQIRLQQAQEEQRNATTKVVGIFNKLALASTIRKGDIHEIEE